MNVTPRRVAPAHSTDNAIARYDGNLGVLQDSNVAIADNGQIIMANAGFKLENGADVGKALVTDAAGVAKWEYMEVPLKTFGNRNVITRVLDHFNSSKLEADDGAGGTTQDGYIHIHTDIFTDESSVMFDFHVEGYAYGQAEMINLLFGGYSYMPADNLYNEVVRQFSGTVGVTDALVYRSSGGEIILRFKLANTYYTTFKVNSQVVGNGRVFDYWAMSVEFSASALL